MRKKMAHFQKNLFLLGLAAILSVFLAACGGGGGGGGTPVVNPPATPPFQPPAGITVRITDIDTTNCPNITAFVAVNDDQNASPVLGLTAQSFVVTDKNATVLPFVSSEEARFEPVVFSLAMDYSKSLSDQDVIDMEAAAVTFIQQAYALTIPDTFGEIIKFAGVTANIGVMQDFTEMENDLVDAVNADFPPRLAGESLTVLYDAIGKALEDVTAYINGPGPAGLPSYVIVITDGQDTNSQNYTVDTLIQFAKDQNIPIVTIGFGDSTDPAILFRLANETGGIYIQTPTAGDLNDSLAKLLDNLSNYYLLAFTDPGVLLPQAITVDVTTPGGLVGSDSLNYNQCP